ncbi:Zinc metalloproteinase nas-4 [Folsomia candida]|uniref:Metalloendopeptidase n=1 Tax=Folsomia candida TaxID=158441 RepID=A0A226D1M9_FOLCA|nr:Zinc metalloproteinase nas-4 [Folsomia candida]
MAVQNVLNISPLTSLVAGLILALTSFPLASTVVPTQQNVLPTDSSHGNHDAGVCTTRLKGLDSAGDDNDDDDYSNEFAIGFDKPQNYDQIMASLVADSSTLTNFTEDFGSEGNKGRGATKNLKKRWNYEMKVAIDPEFAADVTEQIEAAIFTLQTAMQCFKFLKAKKPEKVKGDHVYFKAKGNDSGCYSGLGRHGGRQEIVIQPSKSCKPFGTAVHETMHALGFYHEHTRPDRDEYVDIKINGTKQADDQYAIIPDQLLLVKQYDFESIMHYPPNPVLQPKSGKVPDGVKVGQRDHLSKLDVERLNALYPCDKKPKKERRRRRRSWSHQEGMPPEEEGGRGRTTFGCVFHQPQHFLNVLKSREESSRETRGAWSDLRPEKPCGAFERRRGNQLGMCPQ